MKNRPSSEEVTAAMGRMMSAERIKPKHLIVDQGPEFDCDHFKEVWCKAMNILPRFGAVGKHGSIAIDERFHRTVKELLRLITVPEVQCQFESELGLIIDWYNAPGFVYNHSRRKSMGHYTPRGTVASRRSTFGREQERGYH